MRKIYSKIEKFQKDNNITYKTNPFKLCKNNSWYTIPYSKFGIEMINLLKISNEGFSVFDGKNYFIFYNPFLGNDKRLHFTIAHEIGHIVLDHHRETNQQILMYSENNYIENQANIFARNILMPASITRELIEVKTIIELSELFEVSVSMANVRVSKLNYDLQWLKHVESKNFYKHKNVSL